MASQFSEVNQEEWVEEVLGIFYRFHSVDEALEE